MPLGSRDCPNDCGRSVQAGKLMCYPCWKEVPTDIQRRVYSTWRAVVRGDIDALEQYEQARNDALASIN